MKGPKREFILKLLHRLDTWTDINNVSVIREKEWPLSIFRSKRLLDSNTLLQDGRIKSALKIIGVVDILNDFGKVEIVYNVGCKDGSKYIGISARQMTDQYSKIMKNYFIEFPSISKVDLDNFLIRVKDYIANKVDSVILKPHKSISWGNYTIIVENIAKDNIEHTLLQYRFCKPTIILYNVVYLHGKPKLLIKLRNLRESNISFYNQLTDDYEFRVNKEPKEYIFDYQTFLENQWLFQGD